MGILFKDKSVLANRVDSTMNAKESGSTQQYDVIVLYYYFTFDFLFFEHIRL